jgi:hypothetical protein
MNYPPIGFAITAAVSHFTGSILVTGRVIGLLSFFIVAFCIFGTVFNFTSQKLPALFAAVLWLALMTRIGGKYIGMFEQQMLAHAFAAIAFYLYSKWLPNLTFKRTATIAFLCCAALFTKHLVVAATAAIAVALIINNRRAVWQFFFIGTVISSLMALGLWLYAGSDFYNNFIDFDRSASNGRLAGAVIDLFVDRYAGVLLLPACALFLAYERSMVFSLSYLVFSLVVASYSARGVGVGLTVWIDFLIAAGIVAGLFAAHRSKSLSLTNLFQGSKTSLQARIIPLAFATALIVLAVAANEVVLARILSADGSLDSSSTSKIRMLQLALVLSGIGILARKKIAAVLMRINVLPSRAIFLAVLVACILPVVKGVDVSYQALRDREDLYRKAVAHLQSISGDAVSEDLLLGYRAGKRSLLDSFNVAQMMAAGRIPEEVITKRIRNKEFGAVVLSGDLESYLIELSTIKKTASKSPSPRTTVTQRWTDNTLHVLGENYTAEDFEHRGNYYFYVPKRNRPAANNSGDTAY